MFRTALDSDDLTVFHYDTDFYLTYSDLVADPQAFETAHLGHQVLYIDRGLGDPGLKATIADVERGALTPADLPGWLDKRANAGAQYLTVYANRGNLAAAHTAIGHRSAWWWVATLDGTVTVPDWTPLTGPALVQFAGAAQVGVHADLTLVINPSWHPSPLPPLPAKLRADLTTAIADLESTGTQIASVANILRMYV